MATQLERRPPLENGDRLTRQEFERRFQAMPHVKKAELVEGVVYLQSPVRVAHADAHAKIMVWLGLYHVATPRTFCNDSVTVRLDADNEVQPDALLRLDPAVGGRSHVGPDDYVEGPPELIAEIAASSASYDLHSKRQVYRRCGVQEYLVWQVFDHRIDWWELREGVYTPLVADEQGALRSRVFPGLWLAAPALLQGDLSAVLGLLQQGIGSAEHTAFVS
ncbi:MAG TPA: Uma2 family endonuclease [Roseiflexaceae bacterium]|nr:Uma2 family endonuclease [Roseiflexaceae bacterium]